MSQFSFNELFDELQARERLVYLVGIGGGIALLLLAGFLWWHTTSVNPQRVFWGAIQNNFATQGVTLESTQQSSGSQTDQHIQLQFGTDPKGLSLTTLTQGKAVVKTENLSTPAADYTRYEHIETDKKGKNGKPLDTSHILGVWAKSSTAASPDKQVPQLFSQVLLGLSVPFGNLSASQRQALMQEIHDDNLYNTSFQTVKKQQHNGRLQYVYSVNLQPILYLRFMKDYAKNMGLHELDKVDPNSYSGAKPLTLQWTIDAHSRQLVGVDYGNGHKETYSGYGLSVQTAVPAHPISSAELQKRLSQVQ